MDSIKEDIKLELQRLRLDKRHLYTTLLRVIDVLHPDTPVVVEVVEETPEVVVETPEVVEETPEVPTITENNNMVLDFPEVDQTPKKSTKKKKSTMSV